jgi:hypothetical protein
VKPGHQWIHFDAQFPMGLGHDLTEKFGPLGQLLFIQFLCACKRSFPQGEIRYRTEDEARVILGAHYPFVDNSGAEWTLDAFWKWCGYRRITTTSRRNGRRIVTASRWEYWEKSAASQTEATRKRRSRGKKPPKMSGHCPDVSAAEGGGWRGEVGVLEVGGGNAGGHAGTAAVQILEKLKDQQPNGNGNITPGPCPQCGFFNCECPPEPQEVRAVLRAAGWRREGGTWVPPTTDE